MKKKNNYRFETIQLHAGQERPDPVTGARAVPIYATTSYVFRDSDHAARLFDLSESGHLYTRISNPTNEVFEKRMAALEGGTAAIATASGAAAVTYSIMNIASAGHNIISDRRIYGGTYNLFANTLSAYGITTSFVNGLEKNAFEKAVDENTRAIFVETLGNPNSTIVDIEAAAAVAHKNKIPLIVDNTFASPYLFRPFEFGADVVVHSATKFIGGHGTCVGGVIVESGKFNWALSGKFPGLSKPNPSYHGLVFTDHAGDEAYTAKIRSTLMRDTGAVLSPFHSFVFLQGLETLSLRVERHVQNALEVVKFLAGHPNVKSVNHPSIKTHPSNKLYRKYFPNGGGSIFTFEINGSGRDAKRFIDRLLLFSHLANVADSKSLVIYPAGTTHSQLSAEKMVEQEITPTTIRLSIGTEHIEDIKEDLSKALAFS